MALSRIPLMAHRDFLPGALHSRPLTQFLAAQETEWLKSSLWLWEAWVQNCTCPHPQPGSHLARSLSLLLFWPPGAHREKFHHNS